MNEKNGAKADGAFDTEGTADEPAATTAPEESTPGKPAPEQDAPKGPAAVDAATEAPPAAAPPVREPGRTRRESEEPAGQSAAAGAGAAAELADDEQRVKPANAEDGKDRGDRKDDRAAATAGSADAAPAVPDAAGDPGAPAAPDASDASDEPDEPDAVEVSEAPAESSPEPDAAAASAPASPSPSPSAAAPAPKPVADGRDTPPVRPARRESDSERTSEFVALKPDLPAAAPPRPPVRRSAPSWSAVAAGEGLTESERTREFGAPAATDDRTMAPAGPAAPRVDAPGADAPGSTAPTAASGSGGPAGPPPPLDLLAQLTNTPPKPETPARTAARRVKIWGTLVVLLAIVVVAVQALRPLPTPTLKLTGASTHTADGAAPSLPWPTEGQALVEINGLGRMGSYGEMKPLPIGSVAKVMTTYLILKDHPLKPGDKGPLVPVDQKAQDDYTSGVTEKESVVEVKAGQKVSELEALQAVMLPSANNVARLLARWDASTEEAFIKKMNDTAKSFGMANTTYTDASGLKESTVSTAEDQVNLAKRAMADPVFRQIAKLPSYTSTTTSGGSTLETSRTQHNFNKLVPLYGVVGIKTGSTTKAGGNLLFAAETPVGDTKQLVVGAVFGQHRPNIIETATAASKQLILAADKALRNETVVKKGDVVGRVDDGLGGTVPVVADKDLVVPIWPGASVEIKLTDGGRRLPHTAKAGTVVGTLSVGGGIGEVNVPVSLKEALSEPSLGAKITRLG
ncbi:D-alanyl-D-alanine carboxypeptidase [Streptomyces sp. NBC_00083]|uniref:D-alanyl-D-alanine carboxypeptidase n=1 Tax=Streptomyces sp. NBC_00083 TaxID=2975647 RepID=UPI0022521444|nr:D-alanyl-D-alanine carboxypeptidase [Streptomyces sp. NBC_00083]MCX5384235.1 D-alanyl-D-alanine carboxypeptidase [Streptomyces sp. NBC_00083]